MSRWRAAALGVLLLFPFVVYAIVGTVAMWRQGWVWWVWWLFPVFWIILYIFWRRWERHLDPLADSRFATGPHWTPQDRQAAAIIEAHQKAVPDIPPQQLIEPQFYLDTTLDLALKIAKHYHPKAKDPLGSLTLLEILAAMQLASEDLQEWIQRYVPASHLLTVRQWRTLSRAPEWYRVATNLTWAASVLINPINIGRFVVNKLAVEPLSTQMQNKLLAMFYMAYVRQVGFYLIEMNSGRLRGGAARYRAIMERLEQPLTVEPTAATVDDVAASTTAPPEPVEVTIALIGQVKAGKSSLVNALLGNQQAATDILPLTKHVRRFRLELPHHADRLVLLDTAGYSDAGATPAQLEETREAFQQADLVLLVMNARSPARAADRTFVEQMQEWFRQKTRLRPPPVLGVLTHVDGLSPVMEWTPPYNWQSPSRPKEQNIRAAVDYNAQVFGDFLAGVIPVCTDVERGRVYGVEEWLLPAMATLLSEARACSLIRTLHHELDRGRARKVFQQMYNAGRDLLKTYILVRGGDAVPPA